MLKLLKLKAELARLTDDDRADLQYDWRYHARLEQLPPPGDWQFWSYIAGRGAGKTRTGSEFVRDCIKSGYKRIALVAPTNDDFHKVMVTGESGVLACCPHDDYPEYNENKKSLTWPNGAQAFGYSAEKPNRLRGPQHDAAWCWIAGTFIATDRGPVPIETVKAGDLVWTRSGLRPVVSTSQRNAKVGRVSFDNSASLVGTADHPVYTAQGWVNTADLSEGDKVCVIDASNGMASAGTSTATGAERTTNGRTRELSQIRLGVCTAQFMSIITAKSRKGLTFITETETSSTTTSKIWNALNTASTRVCMLLRTLSRNVTGVPNLKSNSLVLGAVSSLRGGELLHWETSQFRASPANIEGPTKNARRSSPARTAESNLEAVPATSVVSVASTWRPQGQQLVYCLKVDGAPEYFANGILVHNCDEIAAWHGKKSLKPGERSRRQDTWDMLMYGLRLGNNPKCFVSTTPLPVDVIKSLIENGLDAEQDAYTITRGSTYANRTNLAERFFQSIITKYEGTRLGRQELLGELLMDVPGALWTLEMIATARNTSETAEDAVERMQRVVVAVDPSGAASMSDESADEIGIVVAGKGADDYSVIADCSMKGSPTQWARAAVNAYYKYKADKIVAERNFGGEMVRATIQNVDSNIRVDLVTASRGKAIRAEPIALLYERGEVHHIGILAHLEDQLIRMTPGGYIGDGSPDRLDAAVWALTELSAGATVQHFGVA